jgi:hypothetical protein
MSEPENYYEAPQTELLSASHMLTARPILAGQLWNGWHGLGSAVYLLSFLLPAWDQTYGWQLFVLGLFFCYYPMAWPWFANPLLWVALVKSTRQTSLKGAVIWNAFAVLFAVAFGLIMLLNRSDRPWQELPIPWAYLAWLASMLIFLVANFRSFVNQGRTAVAVTLAKE